jgi:hypothetical protein
MNDVDDEVDRITKKQEVDNENFDKSDEWINSIEKENNRSCSLIFFFFLNCWQHIREEENNENRSSIFFFRRQHFCI